MTEQQFDWGQLGESWWREQGQACRATETQLKYACARHSGATMVKSATLAGYSGTGDQLRSAGSRAEGTTAVEALLTLSKAAETGATDNPVTVAEVKRKIGKLVRSHDGSISLKASELFVKLEQAEKARGESPQDDGMSEWRLCRECLEMENGATAFMLLFKGTRGDFGHPANFPLLHDVVHVAQKEPFGQQVFDWCGRNLSETMRQALERQLADPGYQLEARKQIWLEIGKIPPAPIEKNVIPLNRA